MVFTVHQMSDISLKKSLQKWLNRRCFFLYSLQWTSQAWTWASRNITPTSTTRSNATCWTWKLNLFCVLPACWISGVGTSFLFSLAFSLCRLLTALHVHCLWWKCLLDITFTNKGVQMIVLVYSFIVNVCLRRNRRPRIDESCQKLVHSLCHSISSGVYLLLHFLWPCFCSHMGPLPIATRSVFQRFIIADAVQKKCSECVCVVSYRVYLQSRDQSVV